MDVKLEAYLVTIILVTSDQKSDVIGLSKDVYLLPWTSADVNKLMRDSLYHQNTHKSKALWKNVGLPFIRLSMYRAHLNNQFVTWHRLFNYFIFFTLLECLSFMNIVKYNLFLWCAAEFSASLLQSSVPRYSINYFNMLLCCSKFFFLLLLLLSIFKTVEYFVFRILWWIERSVCIWNTKLL